jgi:hypothetical protein
VKITTILFCFCPHVLFAALRLPGLDTAHCLVITHASPILLHGRRDNLPLYDGTGAGGTMHSSSTLGKVGAWGTAFEKPSVCRGAVPNSDGTELSCWAQPVHLLFHCIDDQWLLCYCPHAVFYASPPTM